MTTLDSAKNSRKANLRTNVTDFLHKNYDWRVTRSLSTGTPLTDADKRYRAGIIAEYNNRVAAVNAATTLADVNKVSTVFL